MQPKPLTEKGHPERAVPVETSVQTHSEDIWNNRRLLPVSRSNRETRRRADVTSIYELVTPHHTKGYFSLDHTHRHRHMVSTLELEPLEITTQTRHRPSKPVVTSARVALRNIRLFQASGHGIRGSKENQSLILPSPWHLSTTPQTMVSDAWLQQIPRNPRRTSSTSSASTVPMLSSRLLRGSVHSSERDDNPPQRSSRSVTWSSHVEVWWQPTRSVTWSAQVEVITIPARECELKLDDCDPQCVISAKDREQDDCASRDDDCTSRASTTTSALSPPPAK